MTTIYDPEQDGITHINLHKSGRTAIGRILSPEAQHTPLESIIGITYNNFRVVRGLQFRYPRHYQEYVSDPKSHARLWQPLITRDPSMVRNVPNYTSIVRFLLWERMTIDDRFYNALLETGDKHLCSYKTIDGVIQDTNLKWWANLADHVRDCAEFSKQPDLTIGVVGDEPWWCGIHDLPENFEERLSELFSRTGALKVDAPVLNALTSPRRR